MGDGCAHHSAANAVSERNLPRKITKKRNLPSHKKQAHPRHTDDSSYNLPHRHFLVEEDGGRRDNENRGKGEEGLRNAGGGVQGRQQRGTDTDERAENSGGEHAPQGFAIVEGTAQLLYSVLAEQH